MMLMVNHVRLETLSSFVPFSYLCNPMTVGSYSKNFLIHSHNPKCLIRKMDFIFLKENEEIKRSYLHKYAMYSMCTNVMDFSVKSIYWTRTKYC